MLLLRLNWLLHFKYQYSQKLSLLKQARFCSVIKVLVYISPKIYIFFLKKEIYISHFLVPFLLTLLTIHLVISQPFAVQKSGQKSWLTFTMVQQNHPVWIVWHILKKIFLLLSLTIQCPEKFRVQILNPSMLLKYFHIKMPLTFCHCIINARGMYSSIDCI